MPAATKSPAISSSTSRSCRSPAGSSTIRCEIAARTNTVDRRRARATPTSTAADLAAIGVTNQRETTVVWNPKTGQPWYNAIVWQDTRTDRIVNALDRGPGGRLIRARTGLPPATYFSGAKLQWILDNVDGVREAARRAARPCSATSTPG